MPRRCDWRSTLADSSTTRKLLRGSCFEVSTSSTGSLWCLLKEQPGLKSLALFNPTSPTGRLVTFLTTPLTSAVRCCLLACDWRSPLEAVPFSRTRQTWPVRAVATSVLSANFIQISPSRTKRSPRTARTAGRLAFNRLDRRLAAASSVLSAPRPCPRRSTPTRRRRRGDRAARQISIGADAWRNSRRAPRKTK